METTRQQKIGRLLEKEFGDIFLQYAKNFQGTLISVTRVNVTPDLGIAHVNLSIFPSEKGPEILKNIEENNKAFRYDLGNKVRHQLRIVPELRFHIDDTLDYLERIDELLKK